MFTKPVLRLLYFLCSLLVIFLGIHIFSPYTFVQSIAPVQYDVHGTVIVGQKQVGFTGFDQIPPRLVDLIIQVEDKRFRSHPGVDVLALGRVMWTNMFVSRRLQGASTIDQQLIKLDRAQFQRSRRAKLTEMRRAINLQFHHTKEEIFLRYLNVIPFSHEIRGRNAACQSYRGRQCIYLSDPELLILLATAQLGANPYKASDQKAILARVQMLCRVGAVDDSFCTTPIDETVRDGLKLSETVLDPRVKLVVERHGSEALDLQIMTQIDAVMGTTRTQREQYNIHDCCVVLLNATGEIISMNLCTDRTDPEAGKINTCLTPRQTGSAVKPFLYTYAFRQLGLHPMDTIVDEPVQYDLGDDGGLYAPKNFDLDYHGTVSLAYALGNSLNIPAIKLLDHVGVDAFFGFLREQLTLFAPDESKNPKTADELGLSLALGTYEISPFGFAQLRRFFLPTSDVSTYTAPRDEVVQILRDPLQKIVSFGQDTFLDTPGRAVKTGTSRKFIDGRICGVHSSKGVSLCLRFGNYHNEPMRASSSEVGSYLRKLITDLLVSF